MGQDGQGRPEGGARARSARPSRVSGALRALRKTGTAVRGKVGDVIHRALEFAKRAPWKTLAAAVFTVVVGPLVAGIGVELLKPVVGPDGDGGDPEGSPASTARSTAEVTTSPKAGGAPPVEVVSTEVSHSRAGDQWVAAEPVRLDAGELAELDRLQGEDRPAYEERMRGYGAGELGRENIRAVVRGGHADGARIMQMRAAVECSEPYTGALFYSPDAGREAIESLYFDLDSADPVAQELDEKNRPVGEYFSGSTYELEPGEEVVFDIVARTAERSCDFTLEMDVLAGGGRSVVAIDDDGSPFRVSAHAPAGAYETAYVGGVVVDGDWHRVDEDIEDYGPWGGETE